MTPGGVLPPYPMAYAQQPFRSLGGLAVAMYVLLPIAGLLALTAIPVSLNARSVVHDHASDGVVFVTPSVKDATDAVAGVVGFSFLVGLALAVLFIIWMWRAASNLQLFGRVKPKFGPGFAIGGWFIPLANLIIPGMHMFDIDKGSGPPLRPGERARGSGLVVVWWIMFIVGRMLGMLAPSFEGFRTYDVSNFDVQNVLLIVGSAFTAVAAVAAILVIRQVTAAQEAGLADLQTVGAAPAQPAPVVAYPPVTYPPVAGYPPVAPAPPAPPVGGEIWPGPADPPVGSDPE